MYHRPSTKRPQVFDVPSMSQRGKLAQFVMRMSGLSLAWSACCSKMRILRPARHVVGMIGMASISPARRACRSMVGMAQHDMRRKSMSRHGRHDSRTLAITQPPR
jgi:hypothetical protein